MTNHQYLNVKQYNNSSPVFVVQYAFYIDNLKKCSNAAFLSTSLKISLINT